MKTQRLQLMEEYILERDYVTMNELCEKMSVSINTARQDVAQLMQMGKVKKVYGGVRSNNSALIPFNDRSLKNVDRKIAISKKAATYINENDVIYLDSGTTTMRIIDYLTDKKHITVITNSLSVINMAAPYPNIEVISLAGKLERSTNSFVSSETVKTLRLYNITKCFMASTGISQTGDVTNSSLLEYEIKKVLMEKSQMKFLLIDATKYDKVALMTYANISDFQTVITNLEEENCIGKLCEKLNVKCDKI